MRNRYLKLFLTSAFIALINIALISNSFSGGNIPFMFFPSASTTSAGLTVEYLVIGGGGSGGKNQSGSSGGGGGGGAGGFRTGTGFPVTAGSAITVTVGAGGAAQTTLKTNGNNGSASSFSTIVASGGGGGGGWIFATPAVGSPGGSGGGAPQGSTVGYGAGNIGSFNPSEGNNGGASPSGNMSASSGGGGAGSAGANVTVTYQGSNGGSGVASSISGSSVTYAGGGGGGSYHDGAFGYAGGLAGTGGGGAGGGGSNISNGVAGTPNTGGGGGGGGGGNGSGDGGAGGSGVVIIRYPDTYPAAAATTGSVTYTATGGYRIYQWTSSGTINFSVDCVTGSPTPGAICAGGAIYLGSLSPGATSGSGTDKYMTTPGGCGEIPAGQIVGSGASAYPNADFTPTCSGTDSLNKYWNDGSASWAAVPGLVDYTNTLSTGYGAINTDQYYGSTNTTNISNVTAGASGGYHAAARYCDKLNYGGYTDWYLPNRYELNLFLTNKTSIPGLDTTGSWYWSSTESNAYGNNGLAWVHRYSDGYQSYDYKNHSALVRCVRRY